MTIEAVFKLNKVIDADNVVEKPSVIANEEDFSVSFAVSENTHYRFTNPLTSLTISSIEESPLVSSVSFKVSEAGATVNLPILADTVGPTNFKAGHKYILLILMNTIFIYEKN